MISPCAMHRRRMKQCPKCRRRGAPLTANMPGFFGNGATDTLYLSVELPSDSEAKVAASHQEAEADGR